MRSAPSGASWLLALCSALAVVPGHADALQQSVWQPHHVQLDYFGITSLYSCRALQAKLKLLLEYLGARADADVQASGCPQGDDTITRSIMLVADFSTLAPAGNTSGSLASRWSAVKLAARKPALLDDGDCELIQQSRRLFLDNFSWRAPPRYQTECPLNGTAPGDFRIQGEALKPAS